MDSDKRERAASMFATAATIRALEECLLELFSEGRLSGTTHTYLGQEGLAAALCPLLHEDDVVFSSHRCHGHYVMYGGPLEGLLGEVMGKACGVCGGRGGSQHLHYKRFFSSGIQGGIAGNATGAALALKQTRSEGIAIVFLGDGTLGEGLVYESLNFASLNQLPVLFVLEDNGIAQSTPTHTAVSGSILARAAAFGMACAEITSNDALELNDAFAAAADYVRSGHGPFFQAVHTFRMGPHSKGDDTRAPEALAAWRERDPLVLLARHLDEATVAALKQAAAVALADALRMVEASPASMLPTRRESTTTNPTPWATRAEPMVKALNRGLHAIFSEDKSAILVGEDLLDPYGGAFKVSAGLSTVFPDRVYSTPISEAGIVAWSVGASLLGLRPIAEIMFGDFLALAADQIINHAAKYGWVSGGEAPASIVIRTPMGGHRGYGPTHSQCIEKHFLGVGGLRVIAANLLLDPGELLRHAVAEVGPVLFIENKVMYAQPMLVCAEGRIGNFTVEADAEIYPTLRLRLAEAPADAVIVAYGGMISAAMAAAERLMLDEELVVEVIAVAQLSPLPIESLLRMLSPARVLVTAEEAHVEAGWGAEVLAVVAERAPRRFDRLLRVGAALGHVPAARALELEVLPGVERLVETVLRSVR